MLPSQMYGSSHGHGHSHVHKHGHKKRDQELAKSQSNPALSPVLFESAPLPHVRASVSSMEFMGTGQPHSMDVSMTASASVDPPPQSVKTRELDPPVGKPPPRPLWRKGWKASRLVCTVPKLHQPSPSRVKSVGETTASVSTALDFPLDKHGSNLTLHCIDLQAHNKHMKSLLSSMHTRVLEDDSVPQPPSRFFSPASLSSKKASVAASTTVSCQNAAAVELDQSSLHKLLRKSTAAICAYSGYNDTSSQALDTLSTVLRDYLTNFTKRLRANADQALENSGVAFADVVDQTLYQCGVGGKAGLDKYWQNSVKGFVKYLEEEIRDTTHEYIQIVDPPTSTAVSRKQGRNEPAVTWPPNLDPPNTSSTSEEEVSLDSVLEGANMDHVHPAKTPDLESAESFSQLSDQVSREIGGDEFSSLGLDGPPPSKRLRTISFGD